MSFAANNFLIFLVQSVFVTQKRTQLVEPDAAQRPCGRCTLSGAPLAVQIRRSCQEEIKPAVVSPPTAPRDAPQTNAANGDASSQLVSVRRTKQT